jgi:ORF6N domain-containing protein
MSPKARTSPKAPQHTRVDAALVGRAVLRIRAHNVLLDSDLAALYGVDVKVLNQAVKRNIERFPGDFMFQLNAAETVSLRSHIVTAKRGRGGRRTAPYVFTEQGVAMLSSVLRSPRAVRVNIEIMRAFVHLRRMLGANQELTRRLDALELKYDDQFTVVFRAIRELMVPSRPPQRKIGFLPTRTADRPRTDRRSRAPEHR